MTVNFLPDAPLMTSPATFAAKMAALANALPDFVSQMNADGLTQGNAWVGTVGDFAVPVGVTYLTNIPFVADGYRFHLISAVLIGEGGVFGTQYSIWQSDGSFLFMAKNVAAGHITSMQISAGLMQFTLNGMTVPRTLRVSWFKF